MITFPRVRAAAWAIGKRLQGYHLLQNPVGTPATEVNMIREKHMVLTPHMDEHFVVSRIQRTFTNSGSTGEERLLESTHYRDIYKFEKNESGKNVGSRAKDIAYTVPKDTKKPKKKDIETGEEVSKDVKNNNKPEDDYNNDLHTREDLPLEQDYSREEVPPKERDKITEEIRIAQLKRRYVETHHSRLYKALAFGLYEQLGAQPSEKRPNFFKVLYRNFTNKGYLKLRKKYLGNKVSE